MDEEELDQIKELADVLETWYANKKKALDDIIKSCDDGKPLKLDLDGTMYELDRDMLKGFRVGIISARAMMGELPFTLEQKTWDDEAEEELEDEEDEEPVPPRPSNFGHFS